MAGALTAMIAAAFAGGVTPDPYFEYTTLLLPGSGTNGAQNNTFLDGSTNNFTITRNGNTTQGTFSPFSQTGWGNYFDGTGDSLNTTSSSAFNFSTGSFTLECWFNKQGAGGFADAVGNVLIYTGSGSNNATWLGVTDSGTLIAKIGYSGSWATEISGGSVSNGVWNHVALVRNGTAVNLYLNGTSIASASNSTDLSTFGTNSSIAVNYTSTRTFNGYISNARIVNSVAVYTGNFTPPTSPLAATQSAGTNISAITGTQTSLLTCQSNRFIDNSTNNFTITRNGDTRVVAFSPFNPTSSWSAATNGGSGYFDGSGDYLTFTDSANNLDLGGVQASVDFWFYRTSAGTDFDVFLIKRGPGAGWSATDGIEYFLGINSNQVVIYYNTGGGFSSWSTGVTITPFQWNHLCVATNTSNNISVFLNGTTKATSTFSIAKPTTRTTVNIGVDSTTDANYFIGYMSGLRFLTGSNAFDPTASSVTVPTAPTTAVTGTQLLLNYTNAGIYDATSKNDLETVGDAQISNTTAKWGSTSIKFDGTGDYLQAPYQTLSADFGTGQFTIELWVYFSSSVSTTQMFVSSNYNASTGAGGWAFARRGDNNTIVFTQGSNVAYGKTWFPSLNTWYHCAVTRDSSNNLRIFVDGTQVGSTDASVTASINGATSLLIGTNQSTPFPLTGYIQDLRITKGYARYTANFTPPTAAFPTL